MRFPTLSLLTKSSVRHLLHHRAQLVLSVVGVALGVAVVLSIDLATRSARSAFRVSAETVSGRATHYVSGGPLGVDDRLLVRIRTEAGVRASAPVVEGYASSPRLPGQALRILGIDPFSEGPFRPFVAGGPAAPDVGAFMTTRAGVVIASTLAERAGVVVGDSLPALVNGRAWSLPVVGTVEPLDDLARAGLADVLLMDVAGAQEVLGTPGRLSRIDVLVADADSAEALARLRSLLTEAEDLTPTGARTETMLGMIAAFDVNLTALSLLALVFGMFLIYNAVTFSVVQRRALLGRLRALGVTKGEILRTILAEATWIGLAGTAIGLAVGVLLGRGLVRLVTRTINDLYFTVTVDSVPLEPMLLAKAAALGVGATLVAALPAALEAAGSEPRVAMLRSERETRSRRAVPVAAGLGVASGILGLLVLLIPTRSLAVSFVALLFIIGGLALLTPAGAVVLVGAARPALRAVSGALGTIAARGVVRSLSRTAPAISALAVAVSVTVGLGVMIQSFRGTLTRWLDATLQADVYVSLPGPTASRASGTLPPDVIAAFASHPEVEGISTYRGLDLVDSVGTFRLVALDMYAPGEETFDFLDGDAAATMRAFRAGDGAIVSEPFSFRRDVTRGDRVEITTPAGSQSVPVLGVFYDYGSDQGAVIVARSLYDGWFDDDGVTSLALFVAPGANSTAVVGDLLGRVPEGLTVIARTNDVLKRSSLEVFDRTFQVTAVLRLLAFVVAFVGVLSALMALELERARELGAMRAWGLEPGELRRLVLTQTGLMGAVAGALAVPMGLALSTVMIFVINKRSFGWTLTMEVGPVVLVQALGLAMVAALLAGVYPAWRMARTSPALALRGE